MVNNKYKMAEVTVYIVIVSTVFWRSKNSVFWCLRRRGGCDVVFVWSHWEQHATLTEKTKHLNLVLTLHTGADPEGRQGGQVHNVLEQGTSFKICSMNANTIGSGLSREVANVMNNAAGNSPIRRVHNNTAMAGVLTWRVAKRAGAGRNRHRHWCWLLSPNALLTSSSRSSTCVSSAVFTHLLLFNFYRHYASRSCEWSPQKLQSVSLGHLCSLMHLLWWKYWGTAESSARLKSAWDICIHTDSPSGECQEIIRSWKHVWKQRHMFMFSQTSPSENVRRLSGVQCVSESSFRHLRSHRQPLWRMSGDYPEFSMDQDGCRSYSYSLCVHLEQS